VSAFSESSFDSEQLVDKGSPLSASELESRLNETELVFFLAGLSVSLVPETFVGAMVMGGTQSFESTMSASLYCYRQDIVKDKTGRGKLIKITFLG
jgi:hypothetical protein